MGKEFTCNICGNVFESDPDWTEEERIEEMKQSFGYGTKKENCGVVCDDCYKKFCRWAKDKNILKTT